MTRSLILFAILGAAVIPALSAPVNNDTLTEDAQLKAQEEKLRQEAFKAGFVQGRADTELKLAAANMMRNQVPTNAGLSPLFGQERSLGETQAKVPNTAEDDLLAAFHDFLSPKVFNQARSTTAAPTTTTTVPPFSQDQMQARFLPLPAPVQPMAPYPIAQPMPVAPQYMMDPQALGYAVPQQQQFLGQPMF